MKKVLVIGSPGSGKSTLSRALQKRTQLPLFYLDRMNWNPDRTTVEREVFRKRLQAVLQQEEWIIDGLSLIHISTCAAPTALPPPATLAASVS